MAINLQRFISSMNAQPPARASDFEFRIFCPKIGSVDDLTFRAENISLPGRNVVTADNIDVGPQRKIGYSVIYPETSISFVLDERFNQKEYFDRWIDEVVGPHRVQKNPGGNRFNAGYYDDYKGTVDIQNFSSTGQPTYITSLKEAWPISIAAIALDWGSADLVKLGVTFSYRYYEQVKVPIQTGLGTDDRFGRPITT